MDQISETNVKEEVESSLGTRDSWQYESESREEAQFMQEVKQEFEIKVEEEVMGLPDEPFFPNQQKSPDKQDTIRTRKRCRQATFEFWKQLSLVIGSPAQHQPSTTAVNDTTTPWSLEEEDEEELLMLTLALKKKRKKKWVHELNLGREKYGEYHHLIKELENDEEIFRQYFRLSPSQFSETLKLIENDIRKQDTTYRKSITARERLAITLRYLSTGDTFQTIGFSYRIGATTVSEIVNEVCDAIWKNMQPIFVPEPNMNTWINIEKDFNSKWNFPNCIGAINGKHVNIRAPPNSGSQFFNYKKIFSVVILALVDANYKFTIIDTGSYGKNSDGAIFNHSLMGKRLMNNSLGVPADQAVMNTTSPHVIVGDEAFPLKRNLMRPFPRENLNFSKRIFNYRLSRCRRVAENAFSIYTQQWRVFQKPFQCKVELTDKIIKATAVLHNFLRSSINEHTSTSEITPESASDNDSSNAFSRMRKVDNNSTREAFEVRNKFMEYFLSEEGSVPWQADMVVNRR